jgi:SAM-dependent methyltransferase
MNTTIRSSSPNPAPPTSFQANIDRFGGLADTYDRYRPHPPEAFVNLVKQMAGTGRPGRVVDLGSGTGLSTRVWVGHADEVVGVEPNDEMRALAQQLADSSSGAIETAVRYVAGHSACTGLPDQSADIVAISQALHWMEPEPTFAEAARILRPGGVLAAIDCDWPPTTDWPVMAAYADMEQRVRAVERQGRCSPEVRKWDKEGHLARMRQSGLFHFVHEVVLHHVEMGDADRIVGIALSQGGVAAALAAGISESDLGLDQLRLVANETLGNAGKPFYFCYRVRLAIK